MRFPMTPRGWAALKAELRECHAEGPRLAEVILAARELGDISENADYDAAKDRQAFLEGRIIELQSKIAQADIIDPATLSGDRAVFGAVVDVEEIDSGERATYQIVGEFEADVKQGLISITSPLARALIGHEAGDEVTVKVPGGTRIYEIVDVSFK